MKKACRTGRLFLHLERWLYGHSYMRSLGFRAVLPVASHTATCRILPFLKTDFILIVPPQRLVSCWAPSRRAFLDMFAAICSSSNKCAASGTITHFAPNVKPHSGNFRLFLGPKIHIFYPECKYSQRFSQQSVGFLHSRLCYINISYLRLFPVPVYTTLAAAATPARPLCDMVC